MTISITKAQTELGFSRTDKTWLFGVGVLVGGGLGVLLPVLADVAARVRWWGQMQGPVDFVANLDRAVAIPVAAAVGVVAACVLVGIIVAESVKIAITDSVVTVSRADTSRTVARTDVSAVFLDEGVLVVLDERSRQVMRESVESTAEEIESAFRAHHYPWAAADPHREMFRRWVPGSPDLPASVNALLKVRETALKKKSMEEIDDFRIDAEALGYVIREKKTAQFWRPLVRS